MQTRVVMKFHPRLAPIKAAVFPLVKKDGMPEVAQEIYRALKKQMNVFYDEKSAVGRRYRRQDEAGTPFCITVDGQSLQDKTVTVRDRDQLEHGECKVDDVVERDSHSGLFASLRLWVLQMNDCPRSVRFARCMLAFEKDVEDYAAGHARRSKFG